MTDTSYLTIEISEDGQIIDTKVRGKSVDPSESLLDKPLRLRDLGGGLDSDQDDIAIGEFKTIILIKLIKSDGSYTWLVKDPPEYSTVEKPKISPTQELLICRRPPRCSFRSIQIGDNELWIKPEVDL